MRRKFSPGPDLLAATRAGFVGRHSSLAAWCRDNQITPAWARQVLVGKRRGPSAAKLRARIAQAAGVTTETRP